MANEKKILDFIFELGQLKREKRHGWLHVGIECPESVADHSLRAAQIGYILAKLEKYPKPEEICAILVFHELAECRTGDLDKIAQRYIQKNETAVVLEQTSKLEDIGESIRELTKPALSKSGRAGIISKDADLLETALTAREYLERGYKTEEWITNCLARLKTESARKLGKALMRQKSIVWWKGLKRF